MKPEDDPFLPVAHTQGTASAFEALVSRPAAPPTLQPDSDARSAASTWAAPAVARFDSFDLLDQPRLTGIPGCPGEVITARSTVALRQAHIGRDVLVMFVAGDPRQPVILGVIEPRPRDEAAAAEGTRLAAGTRAQALVDGERQVIEAEREVVLRCGDASITLTRAGKVVIKGHYILSRSTGYNKIKGAAIDIN